MKDNKIVLLVQEKRQFCFKKCIFPIGQSGEASWWMVCYQRGLTRLVYLTKMVFSIHNALIKPTSFENSHVLGQFSNSNSPQILKKKKIV